nr:RNA polymerase sigma-70 factor [Pedobacter panaciterrae]
MPSTKLTSASDQDLLLIFQSGDRAAYKEIFDRYDKLLFLYAYRKLQNTDDAQDVVQEVFINLWNNREHLKINTSLSNYLYGAVRNRALNVFRDKSIDDKCIASLQLLIDTETATTDYLIRSKDITLLIEKEISLLPPKMREVFELRRNAYLSNREIAEYLHISEHTVATHIKKALKVLRLRLGIIAYIILITNI